jgi:hypothetical protein
MSEAPQDHGVREIPARLLPVPSTVSPEMQALIAQPLDPSFNIAPETADAWKARVAKAALTTVALLPKLRESLGVSVEPDPRVPRGGRTLLRPPFDEVRTKSP